MLPNGSVKTTSERRLDEVNEFIAPYLAAFKKPLRILDVAASSGISSTEWHEDLMARGLSATLTATDLTPSAYLIKQGWVEGLLDRQHQFIHLGLAGRGMPPKAEFPRGIVPEITKAYLRWRLSRGAELQEVALVSKRFSDSGLKMLDDDLLGGGDAAIPPKSFEVIRAANVLNLVYFPKESLLQMVNLLRQRLVEGGLLMICKTDGKGKTEGSLLRLRGDALDLVSRLRDGSEIEPLLGLQDARRD